MYMLIFSGPQLLQQHFLCKLGSNYLHHHRCRTCLLLMTLFAILSLSLNPTLQGCCRATTLYIALVFCPALYTTFNSKVTAYINLCSTDVDLNCITGHVCKHITCCCQVYRESAGICMECCVIMKLGSYSKCQE